MKDKPKPKAAAACCQVPGHEARVVDAYCQSACCACGVCLLCTNTSHKGHDVRPIIDIAAEAQAGLEEQLAALQGEIGREWAWMEALASSEASLLVNEDVYLAHLHSDFVRLHLCLEEKEREVEREGEGRPKKKNTRFS